MNTQLNEADRKVIHAFLSQLDINPDCCRCCYSLYNLRKQYQPVVTYGMIQDLLSQLETPHSEVHTAE